MQAGYVEQQPARDHRRVPVGARHLPMPAAEVLLRGETIENPAVVAEVVERIHMRPGMGVHRDRIARVGDEAVGIGPDRHHVGDLLAARGVGHPDLKRRIVGGEPAGHADEVIDGEIEDLAGVGAADDRRAGLRVDQVEHADLIVGAERARGHLAEPGIVSRDLLLRGLVHEIDRAHRPAP